MATAAASEISDGGSAGNPRRIESPYKSAKIQAVGFYDDFGYCTVL